MRIIKALVLAACVLGTACSDPAEPGETGVAVSWVVTPSAVQPHDSLAGRLVIRNMTFLPVNLTSGCTSIANPMVHRFGVYVPVDGAGGACLTALSYYTIAPFDSIVQTFPLRARTHEGAALAAGTYDFGLDLLVDLADPTPARVTVLP